MKTTSSQYGDYNSPDYRLSLEDAEQIEPFFVGIHENDGGPDEKPVTIGELEALRLGIPVGTIADTKTWPNWKPTPLELKGRRTGELILTINPDGDMVVTAIRYSSPTPPYKRAKLTLSVVWRSHRWHTLGQSGRAHKRRLQIKNTSGGVILEYDYHEYMGCDQTKHVSREWDFDPGLYDALASAKTFPLDDKWHRC